MELPKFTTPGSLAPSLSLADSVKNVTSQASNMSIPSVSGPNIQNLASGASSKIQSSTGALGNLGSVVGGVAAGGVTGALIGKIGGANVGTAAIGGAVGGATATLAGGGIGSVLGASAAGGLASTAISKLGGGSLGSALGGSAVGALAGTALGNLSSAAGSGTDALKGQMESLQGAARAKLMASAPELPEQAKGMAGIMEKGVDLGKFQEKSVANLMSKVSDFSPGKSIANLASEKDIAAGLKDKLNSLKPSGALGNALSGALGGAGIGAAVGAITGGGGNLLQNAARGAGIGAAVGGITGAVSGLAGSSTNPISSAVSGITGAASNLAGSATNAIGSALGGGSVANTVASGVTGAVGGTVLGKLAGGQSINLKNFAGNLGGSVGGALGGQIGANLVGSTVPSAGLGAGLGGAVAGLVGGSPAKKALTGLAAGIGLGAVTGVVTNKINSSLGVAGSTPTVQPPTVSGQIQSIPEIKPQEIKISDISPVQKPAIQSIGSSPIKEIPDISKNQPTEVIKIADKSPQSVPESVPPPPPPSNTSSPIPDREVAYITTGNPVTVATEYMTSKEFNDKAKASDLKFVESDTLTSGGRSGTTVTYGFLLGVDSEISNKYTSLFGSKDFSVIRARMEKDIASVTDADKARVKNLISNYRGTFSLGYTVSSYSPVGQKNSESDPQKRSISLKDYIAMDTEDFYKFLTNAAEGQHLIYPMTGQSKDVPYKVFISLKSPSEVNLTVSHPAYGTATSIIPRAVPPPLNELFDYKGINECMAAYHFGNELESKQRGVWNALDPQQGAFVRMYATQGVRVFCCAKKIIIGSDRVGVATGEKRKWAHLPDAPESVQGDRNWLVTMKIDDTLHYMVYYNPYTIEVDSIQTFKLVPKT